jgi:hypothetical protein
MNNLRNGWDNIDELTGIPGYGITSLENFIKGRSVSIFEKIRNVFIRDFIIKSVAALFIVSDLILYHGNQNILILNAVLLVFLVLFTLVGIKYYNQFKQSSDPGKSSKENLTSLLIFLKRKYSVYAVFSATTYLFGFIPGILLYFIIAYGYLKPFTTTSYFVYSFLCFIGMIFGFILDTRQARFHINHIRICLSDLNDNALAIASENIESKRKMDLTIIILIQAVILLLFLVMIAVLKSVFT